MRAASTCSSCTPVAVQRATSGKATIVMPVDCRRCLTPPLIDACFANPSDGEAAFISLSATRCIVTRRIVMLSVTFPGRVAVAVLPVAAIGVRIARPEVLTICIRVELRAIAGVFDNLLRQCGSCGSCRNNSGGANQRVFHLGLLVGFPTAQDGNSHQFHQSTFCMAVLKFNLLAPAERQTYVVFMSDLMGHWKLLSGIRAMLFELVS